MATNPSRGEIYWVDWSPGRGSEQTGMRPALIVSTDAGNQNPRYGCVIVACMSTKGRDDIATHVGIRPSKENGLRELTHVKCEQLMTISKDRLQGRVGQAEPSAMDAVDEAIKRVLALA